MDAGSRVVVTLEVVEPPVVDRLYFWALQVGFSGPGGRTGGAHLGLQWHPRHPGRRAVNWGGYRAGAGQLPGTRSPLPSARDNPNTRDLWWEPGRRYRLRIEPADRPGWWSGVVEDLEDGERWEVRQLEGGGERLVDPVVWSEVFARCDDPPVRVRWSDPAVATAAGWARPLGYRVSYQAVTRGGCTNTTVEPGPGWVDQVTNRARTTPDASFLPLG